MKLDIPGISARRVVPRKLLKEDSMRKILMVLLFFTSVAVSVPAQGTSETSVDQPKESVVFSVTERFRRGESPTSAAQAYMRRRALMAAATYVQARAQEAGNLKERIESHERWQGKSLEEVEAITEIDVSVTGLYLKKRERRTTMIDGVEFDEYRFTYALDPDAQKKIDETITDLEQTLETINQEDPVSNNENFLLAEDLDWSEF